VYVDECEDRVYRLRPRGNPLAQGDFMCDEGRFGWKYLHSDQRILLPEQRSAGKAISRDWDVVLPAARSALAEAAKRGQIAAVLSPWMTLEEAYLLASYMKSLSPNAALAMGPVHTIGEDDKYPKDVHGRPLEPTKFTIRAEKCPNRRGVDIILKHFAGSVTPMGDVLGRASGGQFAALYLVGGDPQGWINDQQAAALEKVGTVIVQDILPSAATQRATFVLAGASFAERDGIFVNHAGLAQEIHKSIRGPGEAKPDGRILWDLAERRGLLNLKTLRTEMAEKIADLKMLAEGELGQFGVRLHA
jgi:NADH-quinone oxidoreductase subunit G